MTSQTLREARSFEEIEERQIREDERPSFHLSVRTGWLNDPNGFSFYQNQYHLFYQYYPYDTKWGPMHWGHAVSEDLLHWNYLPAVMAPDELYDREGCFSGSAVTLPDGRHLLMYTGVGKKQMPDGEIKEIQTQCLAVGNGTDYVKYEKNPVLDENDLPEGASKIDFRDPKIWQEEDGSYRCVTGSLAADGSGQILLFSSTDGFSWDFKKILCANENRYGKMWECPDFFELDGKQVLLTSPQDMLPQGFEFHNGNGTLCIIGNYDRESEEFTEEGCHAIDYGIDFYAAQTMLAPDGRRIMIGWMQNWDTCGMRTPKQKWFGQMSLPRELSVRNGRLYQWPVKELEELRGEKVAYENVVFEGLIHLDGVQGRKVDMELVVRPDGEENYHKFAVRFAQDDTYQTSLSFRPHESILKIDRKFSGSRRGIIHQRRCQTEYEKELRLRLILDRFSVEVFVNGGEKVMTATMYTDLSADGISFFADGKVCMDVVKYALK